MPPRKLRRRARRAGDGGATGRLGNANPASVAPAAPRITCPCPPMSNSPARKARAIPNPAIMSGSGRDDGFRNRPEGGDEIRGLAATEGCGDIRRVSDGSDEKRAIGLGDRGPGRGQGMAGRDEEILPCDHHARRRENDDERPDDQGAEKGEEGYHRRIPPSEHGGDPIFDVSALGRFFGAHGFDPFRLEPAPAIKRPIRSRDRLSVSKGPASLPRYMTRIRSARAKTSSSSAEISNTAFPWSRAWTRRRWTYSIEPTSSPRVGWAAMMSLIVRESSRATMTFC